MVAFLEKYQSTPQRIGLHVLFWVCYACAYIFIYGSFSDTYGEELKWMVASLPVKLAVTYFTLYFIIPRYFVNKKYISATLYSILALLVGSILQRFVDVYISIPLINPRAAGDALFYIPKIFKIALGIYPVVALASFIKITKHFYTEESKSRELNQQKLEAELNFLKGQIHPHFLFNTLNNLYALTLKKSEASPEVVLKLSDLLSFMLYECNSPTVPLSKELKLVEDFIALEKIRYSDRLTTSFVIDGDVSTSQIPPMLLLPFVENAFKHGTSDSLDNVWVKIEVSIQDSILNLCVENSNGVEKEHSEEFEYQQGIGLKNVTRRLDLLYEDAYSLDISDTDEKYSVDLRLEMDQLLAQPSE